jgi:hypothetical protein
MDVMEKNIQNFGGELLGNWSFGRQRRWVGNITMDTSDSGPCPMASFGVCCVGRLVSVIRGLRRLYRKS